jgi:exodeoxyribonuclease VII large subunit
MSRQQHIRGLRYSVSTGRGASGGALKTDIKSVCLAKVRFNPLYGLDLIVEDVDPSYALGDLAAKLARIREHLQRAGMR